MNRKVLALLVPALLVAGAANAAEIYNKNGNKLDLYGKVDGLRYFSDNPGDDGDQSYARIGFKGETQINDMLTGYGQWEYNIKVNATEGEGSGANSWTRLGFAGLKFGEYGSFDYGRNYGVIYDIEARTDALPEFGGDTYTQTVVYMLGRTNGVATYRNTDFFGLVEGLNFALQYQGNNENGGAGEGTGNGGSRKLARENGDGFGMSASYDFDFGLSLGAAYSSSDRTDNQVARGYGDGMNERNNYAGGETAEAWTVGAKYDAYNVYLAAMYAETRNMTYYGGGNGEDNGGIANKTQNFEVVAQYQFDFGLRPSIAYLQSKGKDLGGQEVHRGNWRYTNKDLVKYVDVGMTYYFNKNMSTYVDYKINLLDEDDDFYASNGIATDDIVGVGLVYQF
ncbi:porin OmpS1 [Salmonella enterica subsp. enterica]|uniref:porin OmpS1 n=1 Tax=Salmonella enterica TaxID=28901 RepID=UPI0009B0EFC1|nr:porin OmpS1 [Salmonella enterica]EAA7501925.1 porin OmpS1 [Salmonella enterica subsp. enterica serovar Thompson]EDT6395732.1 porin OmpS1 [Salmonella enterica subsp. enterica]EKS2344221.1 porin OmpS1 [Salmonella enterica]HBM1403878.1 porin OmpS1 [Salmonella enterica subsp. enterica]